VLILRGSRDLVAGSDWSRALAETALDGELEEIKGAFHGVHHSAAGPVAARITSFITGSEGRFNEPDAA
jgi:pimeloyl-ACP methyl ester carboxylesterase